MDKNYFKRNFRLLVWMYVSFVIYFTTKSYGQETSSVFWMIDNTASIDGNTTTKLGAPVVIESELGPAVEFDGVDDGLIVDSNPLAGADSFTVEVIFNPYEALISSNEEQRFIHIQESDDKRILIELRLTENGEWFLDTFIKDGDSNCTLYANEFPHTINKWYHAALVYKNSSMSHYVNGIIEMSGKVEYTKMISGQTSIGVRLNQRSWFKGAIRSLRVSHAALEPEDFMINITNLHGDELSNVKAKKKPEFILYQNYPNPFNPETTIYFNMSVSEHVELTIFDNLGRKVSTLLNEYISAGNHRIKWSANDNGEKLAGGIYFAQINSTTVSKNIKLIYLP